MSLLRFAFVLSYMCFSCATFAGVVPWTSSEISFFSVSDTQVNWTGNTLHLSYGEPSPYVYPRQSPFPSNATTVTVGPYKEKTLGLTGFYPVDTIGMSFDFSHTGSFDDYAQVSLGYFNPNQPGTVVTSADYTSLGVNKQYRTVVFPSELRSQNNCTHANRWQSGLDDNNICAPDVIDTFSNGVDHVEMYFTPDMLKYQDGLQYMFFQVSGPFNALIPGQVFEGSVAFANVSWLIADGSSANINRWHISDSVQPPTNPSAPNSVPEPASLLLIVFGLLAICKTRRRLT